MNNLNLWPTSVRLKYLDKKLPEIVNALVLEEGVVVNVLKMREKVQDAMEQIVIEEGLRVRSEDVRQLVSSDLNEHIMSALKAQNTDCSDIHVNINKDIYTIEALFPGHDDVLHTHFDGA